MITASYGRFAFFAGQARDPWAGAIVGGWDRIFLAVERDPGARRRQQRCKRILNREQPFAPVPAHERFAELSAACPLCSSSFHAPKLAQSQCDEQTTMSWSARRPASVEALERNDVQIRLTESSTNLDS
jgi:hypothetical protein